ncbi:MAG TPA: primosomal protein N', partial [Phenylobacterium sp.]|nr:primosomal protein N' [Phenylobacterium sp.]
MSRIASVLLPMPLPEAFDYAEPEGMALAVGDQVAAPLGPRLMRGVVVALREAAGGNRPLKAIDRRLDEPSLPPNTLEFVQWAARYAVDAPGQPLAIALRGARAPRPKPVRVVRLTGAQPARPTPARQRVLKAAEGGALSPADLARAAGVSSGVVKGLVEEGVLEIVELAAEARFDEPDLARAGSELNPSQAAAAGLLKEMLDEGGFNVALLDGVTGS